MMTSKANSSNLTGTADITSPGDTTIDGLGTLEWLEQELAAKSALASPSAAPISPAVTAPDVDWMQKENDPSSGERSMQHLVFTLHSRRYALPLANVIEVGPQTNLTSSSSSPDWLLGHSKWRGENIAMVDMRRFLGLGGSNARSGALLVVRSLREGVQIGLVVDEVREIAALPENIGSSKPLTSAVPLPFLQDIQQGIQSLTLVDPEQLLLSSPLHSFTSPAGSIPATMAPKVNRSTVSLQDRVAETVKHLRRTAERSKEMTATIQMIGDMAEQTRLLAMNASIKAAAAGEAGHDFALIAGEVERLADRCAYSSRQMLAVVESVQSENAAVASSLEPAAQDIASLAQSTTRADGCVSQIESLSGAFLALVKSISQAAGAQARSSEAAAKAIDDMLSHLREIERASAEAQQTAGSFATLTGDLKSAVRAIQGKE